MSKGTTLKEELLSLIDSGEHKPVTKKIKAELFDTKLPHKDIYDIFGAMTKKDPKFFMTHLFQFILKNKFKIFGSYDVVEMSKYILENFCFLEGEELIEIFTGDIYQKTLQSIQYRGTIFLTNYRIILVGDIERSFVISFGLIPAIISDIVNMRRRAMRDSYAKEYSKEFSFSNVGEWGYVFPIINVSNISRDDKHIWYKMKLEIKNKIQDVHFSIRPYPYRAKKQTKEDHLKNREHIITQIQQLLEKYQ